jgi:hypothetical protein
MITRSNSPHNRFAAGASAFALAALIISVLFCACCLSGCKLSPERVAYNATATTITTADAAIHAWFAYVETEERRIASLRVTEPEAASKASTALAAKEDKVRAVWDRYAAAARLAVATGANAGQYDPAAVDALRVELFALISNLTR